MAHIDSRRERRRSKMLDHANQSVRGSRSCARASTRARQEAMQLRRSILNQPLRTLRDIRCSLADECDCAACDFDDATAMLDRLGRDRWSGHEFVMPDHLAPGLRMAARKLEEFDGEFDPWMSWLKSNLPDTLAGRHLLDHIVWDAWCCLEDAKHNYRGCRCDDPNEAR